MAENLDVKMSHRFTASAERVYDAWLDPDKVRVWLKTAGQSMGLTGDIRQVEIDPSVGGGFLFTWILDEAEESNPGRVSLVIQPDGTGCVATIAHEMDAKWAGYEEQTKNGWSCMMQATEAFLQT